MNKKIDERLTENNIILPKISAPAANYVPYVITGNLVIISGQLPIKDGKPHYIGKIGRDFSTEEGKVCAQICGTNILAHLKNACEGDLDKVRKCLRMGVFVNATEDYTEQPQVANGVSDMMVSVFGDEIGSHARAAVGVGSLPLGVAVEVEAMFEIE